MFFTDFKLALHIQTDVPAEQILTELQEAIEDRLLELGVDVAEVTLSDSD